MNLIENEETQRRMPEESCILREQEQVLQHCIVSDQDVGRVRKHLLTCELPLRRNGVPKQAAQRRIGRENILRRGIASHLISGQSGEATHAYARASKTIYK